MQASNESNTETTLATGNQSYFARITNGTKDVVDWFFGGTTKQTALRLGGLVIAVLSIWRVHFDYRWSQDRLVAAELTYQFMLAPAIPGTDTSKGAPTRADMLDFMAKQQAMVLQAQGKAQAGK